MAFIKDSNRHGLDPAPRRWERSRPWDAAAWQEVHIFELQTQLNLLQIDGISAVPWASDGGFEKRQKMMRQRQLVLKRQTEAAKSFGVRAPVAIDDA